MDAIKKTLFLFVLLSSSFSYEVIAENDRAGQIVTLTGDTKVLHKGNKYWISAKPNQVVYEGDTLRTGTDDRARLLLDDESALVVNNNSEIILKTVAKNAGWFSKVTNIFRSTVIQINRGVMWFRNKNKQVDAQIHSPTVTVGIRGTEFNISVTEDQSEITVQEGLVEAKNDYGAVLASAGDGVTVKKGQAPKKQVLISPEISVQWTANIPKLISSRNFKISGLNADKIAAKYAVLSNKVSVNTASDEEIKLYSLIARDLGVNAQSLAVINKYLQSNKKSQQAIAIKAWNLLDLGMYKKSADLFSSITSDTHSFAIGHSIALSELGRLNDARKVLKATIDSSSKSVQLALIDIELGNYKKAIRLLNSIKTESVLLLQAKSLAALISDDISLADKAIKRAMQAEPNNASSLVVNGFVQQSAYNLSDAQNSFSKALSLENDNLIALINLAKMQFANNDLVAAESTINRGLEVSPDNAELLNISGYIAIARNNTQQAINTFNKALKKDSSLADAYMGLSLVNMRSAKVDEALENISKATLLDSRRSVFLSYWGKMLHQIRRFDKAADLFDRAHQLDKNDPTPLFYKSILMRDLNRPGEAVKLLNQAIASNGNRGVYRSRFLLDQDLATRNVDLSQSYKELGLDAWAQQKAIDSIKTDYTNSSAHLLMAGSLIGQEGRAYGALSEFLIARMFMPANQNSFNSFNEYTTLFDQPSHNLQIELAVGSHNTTNLDLISYGGVPENNFAYGFDILSHQTDGWRDDNNESLSGVVGFAKWDPSTTNQFMFSMIGTRLDQQGALFPNNDAFNFDASRNYDDSEVFDTTRLQFGYVRKIDSNENVMFSLLFNQISSDLEHVRDTDSDPNNLYPNITEDIISERPFVQTQLQYINKTTNHQFIAGLLNYSGSNDIDIDARVVTGAGDVPLASTVNDINNVFQSVYLTDTWNISKTLFIDAGVYAEKIESGDLIFGKTWTVEETSPRIGLNWKVAGGQVIRLAAYNYLLPFVTERFDPVDVAGIPMFRTEQEGVFVEQTELVWGLESVQGYIGLNLFNMDTTTTALDGSQNVTEFVGTNTGAEVTINQLLTTRLGLAVSYKYMDIENETSVATDRVDQITTAGMTYIYSDKVRFGLKHTHRDVELKSDNSTEVADVTDLFAIYDLDDKKARIRLDIKNIADNEFNWMTDTFVFVGREPARQVLMTFSYNY